MNLLDGSGSAATNPINVAAASVEPAPEPTPEPVATPEASASTSPTPPTPEPPKDEQPEGDSRWRALVTAPALLLLAILLMGTGLYMHFSSVAKKQAADNRATYQQIADQRAADKVSSDINILRVRNLTGTTATFQDIQVTGTATINNLLARLAQIDQLNANDTTTQTLVVRGATTSGSTNTGSLNVSGDTTLAGLTSNGQVTLTGNDQDVLIIQAQQAGQILVSLRNASGAEVTNLDSSGNLSLGGNATIGGTLTVPNVNTTNLTAVNAVIGNLVTSGQGVFTAIPSGSGVNQGTVYINPVSANPADTLLGLAVNGSEKLRVDASGNFSNAGNLAVAGTTSLNGATSIGSSLSVGGATVLSSTLQAGASTLASLGVTGNTTVGGTLGVTGATSLTTLNTSGLATLNSAAITNNATVGGNLGVTGNTNIGGNLNVAGTIQGTNEYLTGTLYQTIYQNDDNLALYYPMSETSGTTLFDKSGRGIDATTANTTSVDARYGLGRSFNGSTSYTTATAAGANTAMQSNSFSVSVWMKPTGDSASYSNGLGSLWGASVQTGWGLSYRGPAEGYNLLFQTANGTAWAQDGLTYPLDPATYYNRWTQVTASYDAPTKTMRLYIDGVLVASKVNTTTYVPTTTSVAACVGCITVPGYGGDYFNGALDEYKVYNKALSDNEIRTQYLGGLTSSGYVRADNFKVINEANQELLRVTAAGNVGIGTTAPTAPLSVKGTNSNATLGSEMITTTDFTNAAWTSAGWTTTATTATHNTGNTSALSTAQATPTAGSTYQVTYTFSGSAAQNSTMNVTYGGATVGTYTFGGPGLSDFTDTRLVTTTNTAALSFAPNTTFNGIVSAVSIKLVSKSNAVITVQNSAATTSLEVRGTTSITNTLVGVNVGQSLTTGTNNTGLGNAALQNTSIGSNNTAVGASALQNNTIGTSNSAFGKSALQNNTIGMNNAAFGLNALLNNIGGSNNSAFGTSALTNNTFGTSNSAFGLSALSANTIGTGNSAFGLSALQGNTTGTYNTAVGTSALIGTTTGSGNVGVGQNALGSTNTGSNNIGIGWAAGVSATTGNANTTGSQNTFIGYQAGPGSATQLQNSTAIGTNSVVTTSNSLVLGCVSGVNGCGTTAKVGVVNASPAYTLDVGGDINTSGVYRVGGTQICSAVGCTVATSSGILNGTALQASANFNIQSAAVGSITAQIRALTSQTADLLQFQNSSGVAITTIGVDGSIKFPNVTGTPTLSATGYSTTGMLTTGAVVQTGPRLFVGSGATQIALMSDANGGILQLNNGNQAISGYGTGSGGSPYQFTSTNGFRIATAVLGTTGTALPAAYLEIGSNNAASIGAIIRGAASQTGNLLQLQNSSSAVLTAFDSSGNLLLGNTVGTIGGSTNLIKANGASGYLNLKGGAGNAYVSIGDSQLYLAGTNGITLTGATQTSANLSVGAAPDALAQLFVNNNLGASAVGIKVKAYAAQTADILQLQDSSGAVIGAFSSSGQLKVAGATTYNGALNVGTNTSAASGGIYFGTDVNLYRSNSGLLKTDAAFQAPQAYVGNIDSLANLNRNTNLDIRVGEVSTAALLLYNRAQAYAGIQVTYNPGAAMTGNLNVLASSASTNPVQIRGAASQTADLLQFQNNSGNSLSKFSSNGDLQIGGANSAASSRALDVQTASGATLLGADTANAWVDVAAVATPSGVTTTLLSAPATPTVTPAGTTGSTNYSYKIVAVMNSGQTTAVSTAGSTATGNATLTAGNRNGISWSAVTGASSYAIYRTVAGGTSPTTLGYIGSTTSTSFNDTGLAATQVTPNPSTLVSGTTYYYKVTALDGLGGETAASTEVSRAVSATNQAIGLSWPITPGARSYRVYRGTSSGAQTGYFTTTTNSFTDYYVAGLTTATLPTSPTAFGNILTNGSNAQLTIGSVGTPTGQLYLGGNIAPPVTVNPVGTPGAIQRQYVVLGVDASGKQMPVSFSMAGSTTTGNATLDGSNYSQLTWPAMAGAATYNVYRIHTGGGSPATTGLIGNTASTTFNDTGIAATGTTPGTTAAANITSYTGGNTNFLCIPPVVSGNYLFSAACNSGALDTIMVSDISNPSQPKMVRAYTDIVSGNFAVSGKYLYVLGGCTPGVATTMRIYDVGNPANPALVSTNTVSATNVTAGRTCQVYVNGRYAYVANGANGNVVIMDVSNPAQPTQRSVISGLNSPAYLTFQGRNLYIPVAGNNTYVYDISNPDSPTLQATTGYGGSAAVAGRYLYSVLGSTLNISDISNPASPAVVGTVTVPSVMYSGANISVSGHYLFIPTGGNWAYGSTIAFQVYDITNPVSPVLIGSEVSGAGYNLAPVVKGRYAYSGTSGNSGGGNFVQVYDMGGAFVQNLEAGSAQVSTLNVDNSAAIAGGVSVGGGLQVTGDTQLNGNVGISGGLNVTGASLLTGGIQGGAKVNGLSAPSTPTVTPQGTTGATTYSYQIVAVGAGTGTTLPSAAGSTATGNATLDTTNYNAVSWSPVAGATSYRIYRTVAGGTSPTTTGLIATTAATSLSDTGLAASGGVPTADTSGLLTVATGAVLNAGSAANVGLIVKGAASQTGDLLQLQNSSGTVLSKFAADGSLSLVSGSPSTPAIYFPGQASGIWASANAVAIGDNGSARLTVSSTGTTIKTAGTNQASAFQVQNSAGASIFNVDTSNTQISLAGNTVNTGGISSNGLAAPAVGSVNNVGAAGSTTYTYAVTARNAAGGETVIGSTGTTATGNAILDGTNYNTITWAAVVGAKDYRVYRTVSGGTPASTGLIATTTNFTFSDTGVAGTTAVPVYDTSGNSTLLGGQLTFRNFNAVSGDVSNGVGVDVANRFMVRATSGITFQPSTINGSGFISFASLAANTGQISAGGGGGILTLGQASAAQKVQVNTATAFEALGSALFKNSANSATAFQIQDQSAVPLLTADTAAMTVTVKNLVVATSLTVNGHIITGDAAVSGATPNTSNAGAGATCVITGNQTSGTITLTTGTSTLLAGTQCTATISYTSSPRPVVSGANAVSAALAPFISASTSTLTFGFGVAPAPSTVYTFNYFNAQ